MKDPQKDVPRGILASGLLFGLTTLTYVEGSAMFRERGGSSSFARHAFDELISFGAAWAQMLVYVVTVATSAFFVPHYLSIFWEPLKTNPWDIVGGVVVVLARGRAKGRRGRAVELTPDGHVLLELVHPHLSGLETVRERDELLLGPAGVTMRVPDNFHSLGDIRPAIAPVRDQRLQYAKRGRLILRRPDQPINQHARGEKAADQLQDALVGHPLGHQPHQDVVVDPVEELLQVDVHDKAVAGRDVRLRLFHGLMRRAPRPEAVAVLGERRIPLFLKNLQHGLLNFWRHLLAVP